MLGIERAWQSNRDAMAKPRQVFVTQSRVLAVKVEEYFTKLMASLATGALSKEELAKIAKAKKNEDTEGLVDQDDEVDWRSDLPARFCLLEDQHFPLFVTFDKVSFLPT